MLLMHNEMMIMLMRWNVNACLTPRCYKVFGTKQGDVSGLLKMSYADFMSLQMVTFQVYSLRLRRQFVGGKRFTYLHCKNLINGLT